jgi:hypothetical protein
MDVHPGATAIARALQDLLERHVIDPLTTVTVHSTDASAGLWARIGGAEYFIQIKPSARQQFRERRGTGERC